MKVVVRRTPRFQKAFETFLGTDDRFKKSFADLPQIFQKEAAWGRPIGKDVYKSEMFMEFITCYSHRKKDTVETIAFAVELKVRRTEGQTTVTLQTIYTTGPVKKYFT